MRFLPCALALLFTVGCPRPFPTDAGAGDAGEDAGVPVDAGPRQDAGALPMNSEPSPPAQVVRTGTSGLLLRGIVLAPSGPILDGELLVVGDSIACVAEDCSSEPGAADATVIDTFGVISPGLIDAHNHLTYNFIPEWEAGTTYDNRYVWSDEASYEDWILPFTDGRNENARICPGAKWGELRSIVHGTTTVMGQSANRSCLQRLARNADHYHGLGYDHMRTAIGSPRDITDDSAANLVASFSEASDPTTRYAVHMQEGVTGNNVTLEFDSFAGRDTRNNRHMGTSLLAAGDGSWSGVGLLIHSMGLSDAQLMEIQSTDAHVVWSPSSNLILYGVTAPIERMIAMNLSIGIGPDWTLSGEDDVLSEMRFGHAYGVAEGIGALTPERLWIMATQGSADAVGLGDRIGRLEVGYAADVTVFGRVAMDPYQAVLDSAAADIRLVLIDGEGYVGDLDLEMAGALNGSCDVLDACGAMKFVCVADTPGSDAGRDETLDDVRNQVDALMAMYGRTGEYEPLVRCD